ncbi:Tf2-9, partial [Mucuna pruriens]
MPVTRNQASSTNGGDEDALQRLLHTVASLQARNDEQSRLSEEAERRFRMAEERHQEALRRVQEKAEKLQQELEAMKEARGREGQPFSQEIDETRVPPNFREIVVEPFDGSQDPHAHLQAFQAQMYISGGDDRLSCKLFPGTLKGVAMQWMATLPPRTIQTFNDLAGAFTAQFAANKKKQLEVADLFDIKQSREESLKSYLARFNMATVQVNDPDQKFFIKAFQKGLRASPFSDSLALKQPNSMAEIRTRAEKHIEVEEDQAERMMEEQARNQRNAGRAALSKVETSRRTETLHKDKHFTPLNEKRAQILREICHTRLLRFPPPSEGKVMGNNPTDWCEFHHTMGHSTEACWTLKTQIERLIQGGRLTQYVNTQRHWTRGEGNQDGVAKEATKYTILGQQLYRRGFSFPLLRCLDEEESLYVHKEIHEGICGTHIGGRTLASKIAKAGYYWPTMKRDCMEYVKKCDKCQRFAEGHKAPPENLHHVISPWPFFKWGVDILGPFPPAPGQVKFLIVAVDYFTKWIEAEPVATITAERVKKFYWKKIICRFGIPAEIVSDNGTQFASKATTEFCQGLKIRQVFTSVEHPQSNGQAEAANKVILRGLRKRLEEAKGRWAEELHQVLWSYHTTPHSSTNETPFRLTFGTEAMIPVEIGEPSPRTILLELGRNEEELRANLDLIQEVREIAHIREYAVKARAARRYNRKVVPRSFKARDLVLKKVTMTANKNKLIPLWEGPFRITNETGQGAYKLENLEGKTLPRTWNAASLRMYYS